MPDATADDKSERATFVLRLWRGRRARGWTGQLEHVQSGERRPAPDLAELPGLIRGWLRRATPEDDRP